MRLGLNSKWVNDSLAKKATTRELPRTGSDSISKIILSLEKKNTPSNFDDIMTRVGEWGLTVAKRGKNSIYLLKE